MVKQATRKTRRKRPLSGSKPLRIVTLSGGPGHTADRVLETALAQFVDASVSIVRETRINTQRAARRIVREAEESGAIILHTLVNPKVRAVVIEETKRRMVPAVDLLGPTLAVLEDNLELAPRNRPGLAYELRKERFDRIDSVDYTMMHDDGMGIHDLQDADVVLVGVSRSSKSVTCFYLAYRGIRAANVPITMGWEPPPTLLEVNPKRVFGLTMNAQRLQSLRVTREGTLGCDADRYVDAETIRQELHYAHELMANRRWRRIDVSYMAVEEVAVEIIKLAKL